MQYYAFAVPGLEEIAGQELAELGADVASGGTAWSFLAGTATPRACWR